LIRSPGGGEPPPIIVERREAAMSAANVELVRSIYENFGKGDIPAVLAALDPEVEWIESEQSFLPHAGVHRGPQGVVEGVFLRIPEMFSEFAVTPVTLHDAGDVVVVEGRVTGTTHAGRKLDAPVAWVWTVRDGKAVRNMNYHDNDPWREALLGTD
jgi:uncharacterized protein